MMGWVNIFFLFGLTVYGLYGWLMFENRRERIPGILIYIVLVFIVVNGSMIWYNLGEIEVIGLDGRKLMMFWLGYPEYNLSIKFSTFCLLLLFLRFNKLFSKIKLFWHLNFFLCFGFQVFILWKELPAGKMGLVNAFYQMGHVLFINSLFLLLLILIYKIGKMSRKRNKWIKEKELNKQKVVLFGIF